MSEAARNRADLSRRLAETTVEAEEAGVENQRLEHRVRVRAKFVECPILKFWFWCTLTVVRLL